MQISWSNWGQWECGWRCSGAGNIYKEKALNVYAVCVSSYIICSGYVSRWQLRCRAGFRKDAQGGFMMLHVKGTKPSFASVIK